MGWLKDLRKLRKGIVTLPSGREVTMTLPDGKTRCPRCDNSFVWVRDPLFDGKNRCDNCGKTWDPCDESPYQ